MKTKIIAVDFDGTLYINKWPHNGEPNLPLITWLKQEALNGTKLILWTCREGEMLEWARKWCEEYGLYFDAINDNVPEANERFGSNPRKVYANVYIDDKAITVSGNWCLEGD